MVRSHLRPLLVWVRADAKRAVLGEYGRVGAGGAPTRHQAVQGSTLARGLSRPMSLDGACGWPGLVAGVNPDEKVGATSTARAPIRRHR